MQQAYQQPQAGVIWLKLAIVYLMFGVGMGSEITADMAAAIGEVLGTGPELWINLENQFRRDKARKVGTED